MPALPKPTSAPELVMPYVVGEQLRLRLSLDRLFGVFHSELLLEIVRTLLLAQNDKLILFKFLGFNIEKGYLLDYRSVFYD